MPPPRDIEGATVLRVADLSGRTPIGRTRQLENGDRQRFAALAIAKYDSDPGYYLFYCDAEWHAVADTYHDSIEEALARAGFDYVDIEFVELGP